MHGYLWGYGYGIDYYYLLLVLPAVILSLIAQFKVKSAYKKMSAVRSGSGLTGAGAAARILRFYGITDVGIGQIGGTLTDNFDPRSKLLNLSQGVYDQTSVAAIGIACHEAGHAVQHAQGYLPIRLRNTILPVCKIGSYAGLPLALIGFFFGFEPLVTIGLTLYSAIMIFQLVTLPVEINASRRALQCIEEMGLVTNEEELRGVKKVLTAAAMTYVASLAVSLANLLRLIFIFTGRSKD